LFNFVPREYETTPLAAQHALEGGTKELRINEHLEARSSGGLPGNVLRFLGETSEDNTSEYGYPQNVPWMREKEASLKKRGATR